MSTGIEFNLDKRCKYREVIGMDTNGYKSKGASIDILHQWLQDGDKRFLNKFIITTTDHEITIRAIKG